MIKPIHRHPTSSVKGAEIITTEDTECTEFLNSELGI
jgi:hypothetical protein